MRKESFILLLVACILLTSASACRMNPRHPSYEFSINDSLPEGNGQNVKVVILSGQSNAAGCSRFSYLQTEPDIDKLSAGYDDVYINFYEAAFERSTDGFVNVDGNLGIEEGYFGPELGIADTLASAFPGEKCFILKFTYSGAGLDSTMSPSKIFFYRYMIKFINDSLSYLRNRNYNPKIVGFCWMQGESDAMEAPDRYRYNMENLVLSLRSDISNDLKIFDAAIADIPMYWVNPDVINAAKHSLSETLPDYYFIDTNALGLTTWNEPLENPDRAHYDAHSELELGRLFGNGIITALQE